MTAQLRSQLALASAAVVVAYTMERVRVIHFGKMGKLVTNYIIAQLLRKKNAYIAQSYDAFGVAPPQHMAAVRYIPGQRSTSYAVGKLACPWQQYAGRYKSGYMLHCVTYGFDRRRVGKIDVRINLHDKLDGGDLAYGDAPVMPVAGYYADFKVVEVKNVTYIIYRFRRAMP